MIAILKTDWVAISLGNLQHLPQDLAQGNCTTMRRILLIENYKQRVGPKIIISISLKQFHPTFHSTSLCDTIEFSYLDMESCLSAIVQLV